MCSVALRSQVRLSPHEATPGEHRARDPALPPGASAEWTVLGIVGDAPRQTEQRPDGEEDAASLHIERGD